MRKIMSKEKIITERLILRKPSKDDAQNMFDNWASDPEVTKFLTWLPHESIDVTKTIINKWLEEENDPKTHRFIISLKSSEEAIGSIDVVNYHDDGNPEIGYCLSRKYWNKGFMTEAAGAFIDYLFNEGYKKVYICAEINNVGSNRVIEKLGFKFTHIEEREHSSSLKPEPVTLKHYVLER